MSSPPIVALFVGLALLTSCDRARPGLQHPWTSDLTPVTFEGMTVPARSVPADGAEHDGRVGLLLRPCARTDVEEGVEADTEAP